MPDEESRAPNGGGQMIVEDARRNRPIFISALLDDWDLDPFEFRVYARLARRANSGRSVARESIKSMASALKMGEHKLRWCLKRLEARGMVDKEERLGKTTVYRLLDEEEWHTMDAIEPSGNDPLQISKGYENGPTPYGSVRGPLTDREGVPLTDQSDEGKEVKGKEEKASTPLPPKGGKGAKKPRPKEYNVYPKLFDHLPPSHQTDRVKEDLELYKKIRRLKGWGQWVDEVSLRHIREWGDWSEPELYASLRYTASKQYQGVVFKRPDPADLAPKADPLEEARRKLRERENG